MKEETFKISEIVHLKCVDLSLEGKGVGFCRGKPIFVTSMYVGDEGDVEISYKRNGQYFGTIKHLDVLSKDRIKPLCPFSSACGGCVYQSINYEAEKKAKIKMVENQFRRNKIAIPPLKILAPTDPYYYRNKIQVPFGENKKSELVFGFYKEKSHQIIPFEECFINDKKGTLVLNKLLKVLREFNIKAYDERTHKGVLRHALIRSSCFGRGLIACLVLYNDVLSQNKEFIEKVRKEIPEITGFFININHKDTNVILGPKYLHIYGDKYIDEIINGLTFRISVNSFFQVNSLMAEVLYKTAIDFADLNEEDKVFDAYSGTGSIGLIASTKAGFVKAIELEKEAVKDALVNAQNNGIHNYEASVGDATEYIEKLSKTNQPFDVCFLDPPRKGTSLEFINAIKKMKPSKVVYVSCNPITLVRDLRDLLDFYEISKIVLVDMFPRTKHVETVMLLSKKNA